MKKLLALAAIAFVFAACSGEKPAQQPECPCKTCMNSCSKSCNGKNCGCKKTCKKECHKQMRAQEVK